jgi:dynein light chain roadblock-type
MSEIEETMKRLASHKGVEMVVICNSDGIVIRSMPPTMDHQQSVLFPALFQPLMAKVRAVACSFESHSPRAIYRVNDPQVDCRCRRCCRPHLRPSCTFNTTLSLSLRCIRRQS